MAAGKAVYVVLVVAMLAVAAGAVVVVKNNNDNGHIATPESLDNAVLKVFGNIDGDEDFDNDDVKTIEKLIRDNASAADYPMADANRDGKIDQADVDLVKKIINGESATIYHVNYHGNATTGVMEKEIVSTKFPIKSAIMTGSTNSFLLMTMCGIVEEVKGASYSSADKALFGGTFLNTDKVTKLGTSSTTIAFEAGSGAASEVIAKHNVTAVITDWNKSYITNEKVFEEANVDVVRVAAASIDLNTSAHSILLLGLLFQKQDRAEALYDLYKSVYSEIESKTTGLNVKAIASSTTGSVSSGDSDYTKVLTTAGASFGLEGYDFGGKASIKVAENLGIFDDTKYNYDYIIHIRTSVSYSDYDAEKILKEYTEPFSKWNNDGNQYIISGSVPVPVRIALAASIMNDALDESWANGIHQKFLDSFLQKYNYETGAFESYGFDLSSMKFILSQSKA